MFSSRPNSLNEEGGGAVFSRLTGLRSWLLVG
uniref:Uncharacterized protein n=1 Tax=Anguilla anguilla TaxID=7936 RepID=A0A0E9RIN5_ANGAN